MHEFGLVGNRITSSARAPTAAYRRSPTPGTATLQFRSVASSFRTISHPFY
jgi:hypothetical protein